jgi:hypothetical protein
MPIKHAKWHVARDQLARPDGKGAYLVTLDRNVLDRSPIAARAGGELFGGGRESLAVGPSIMSSDSCVIALRGPPGA